MADPKDRSFLMSTHEILKLMGESAHVITRIDAVLKDHYVGLNELPAQAHGLACSAHSSASAIVSYIEGIIDNNEEVKGKLKLESDEVQNLASMVLLLAEIKINLESSNVYLELH